ncbi:MAG: DsrE family protein [Gammaproteobacteria bacterium]
MADDAKVFIVMTHGPGEPQRCATPFYMANVAAVMENAAKVVFQIDGVLLMSKGVAESLAAFEGGKPIIDFIREAQDAGVEFYCCSAALERYELTEADLIDECNGVVGAAWMLNESLEADLVLSY